MKRANVFTLALALGLLLTSPAIEGGSRTGWPSRTNYNRFKGCAALVVLGSMVVLARLPLAPPAKPLPAAPAPATPGKRVLTFEDLGSGEGEIRVPLGEGEGEAAVEKMKVLMQVRKLMENPGPEETKRLALLQDDLIMGVAGEDFPIPALERFSDLKRKPTILIHERAHGCNVCDREEQRLKPSLRSPILYTEGPSALRDLDENGRIGIDDPILRNASSLHLVQRRYEMALLERFTEGEELPPDIIKSMYYVVESQRDRDLPLKGFWNSELRGLLLKDDSLTRFDRDFVDELDKALNSNQPAPALTIYTKFPANLAVLRRIFVLSELRLLGALPMPQAVGMRLNPLAHLLEAYRPDSKQNRALADSEINVLLNYRLREFVQVKNIAALYGSNVANIDILHVQASPLHSVRMARLLRRIFQKSNWPETLVLLDPEPFQHFHEDPDVGSDGARRLRGEAALYFPREARP